MNNVRLDGFVYTVESLRTAFGLVKDDGVLALAFYIEKDWLLPKLERLVAEATGRPPIVYWANRTAILCVPKNPQARLPSLLFNFSRVALDDSPGRIALPTDDWPFLYLQRKAIPYDYLVAIGSLLALSAAAITGLRGRSLGPGDLHFGLLGMGFLLLETKSITDCTLFFGATWLVTAIVVTGVLLMVLAANLVATRCRGFSPWMYLPLFAALAVLLLVPREAILALALPWRLVWAVVAVPLPVFFAGVIFSTTFRTTVAPSAVFGANLIGAMAGGFGEYLGMAVGSHYLSLLVIMAYAGSLLTLLVAGRRGAAI